MTAATLARALPRSGSAKPAYLRLVAARRSSAARTPFVVVVVLILLGGLLGLLALNTVLAQDAFTLHALQVQSRQLADREQALQREVADLQSPRSLAARATALGMVPGGPPAFLRLSDGKVLGAPVAGTAPVVAPVAPVAQAPVVKAKPKAPAAGTWQPATTSWTSKKSRATPAAR
ncbi:MAG: hypothetical protein LC789_00095 [Actinobacteria bacterium]|nr:hypothetical protein [Actinomycetota bacterium]MCA1720541.1 hypothetical protein [Actinomycetota bacterium]